MYLHSGRALDWDPHTVVEQLDGRGCWCPEAVELAERIGAEWKPGDHVVLMSNGGFGGLPGTLASRLEGSGDGD